MYFYSVIVTVDIVMKQISYLKQTQGYSAKKNLCEILLRQKIERNQTKNQTYSLLGYPGWRDYKVLLYTVIEE